MIQNIQQSWRQSVAALTLVAASQIGGVPAALALDEPREAVEKQGDKHPESKRRSGEEEREEDLARAKEKLAAVEREIAELREAKRFEEAEKLQRAAAELREHLNRKHETPADKRVTKERESGKKIAKGKAESADKKGESVDELRARLKQLEAENAKLRDAFQARFANESIPNKTGSEPKVTSIKKEPIDSKEDLVARLKKFHDAIALLQKEGRAAEAEKLAAEAQKLHQHLHASEVKKERPVEAEAIERLKREIEESARTGQKERVDALSRELERAAHAWKSHVDKPGPNIPAELGGVIKELREEVIRLRAEVDELRHIVKERDGETSAEKRPKK